jgi:D-sedoheptulose 7-phosphate isomerase
MTPEIVVQHYFDTLAELLHGTVVTTQEGASLGNELGCDQVFAKQLELHLRSGDLMVAISSSGRSAKIPNAAAVARSGGARIITYSGFGADNALRRAGDVNFYARSCEYGFVEVAHLSLCHAVLDIEMGWRARPHPSVAREAELVET